MNTAPFNMLIKIVSDYNILVVTTRCSTNCIFCSHHQNPRDIDVYKTDDITLSELDILLDFVDSSKKIVIGEAATRICEGEPFAHENIIEILQRIRNKYSQVPIQITTSAVNITEEIIIKLKEISNIHLNISLNSSSEEGRKKLYNGNSYMNTIEAINKLRRYQIDFTGSIVALPQVVGWEDIESSIRYLTLKGCSLIKVFIPGITKYTKQINIDDKDEERLISLIQSIQKTTNVPIVYEPPCITSLKAEVRGIIRSSPAYKVDIKHGDIIQSVNGNNVKTRVDAFEKIYLSKNPILDINRNGNNLKIKLKKQDNKSAGIVFEYDINPVVLENINKALKRNNNQKCAIVTSQLGYRILSICKAYLKDVEIYEAQNLYFGGNIKCAGLLTISDIENKLNSIDEKIDVLLLPEIMFDYKGKDLLGKQYMELTDKYGYKIEII